MSRRECWRRTLCTGSCRVCECRPEVLHVPLRFGGNFCALHCPVCGKAGAAAGQAEGAQVRTGGAAPPRARERERTGGGQND